MWPHFIVNSYKRIIEVLPVILSMKHETWVYQEAYYLKDTLKHGSATV